MDGQLHNDDWLVGLTRDAVRSTVKGLGDSPLPLAEQNQRLLEFLMFTAQLYHDDFVVKELKKVREGEDENWHKHWLRDLPWVRDAFFKYYLLGEQAIADAECYLLGESGGYWHEFDRFFDLCKRHVSKFSEATDSPVVAIENALAEFEEKLVNSRFVVVEKECADDRPRTRIIPYGPLRIIQRYAQAANRQDIFTRLKNAVDQYKARCLSEGIADAECRSNILNVLVENKIRSMHQDKYSILKDFPGEYMGNGYDGRRADDIPTGFARNVRIIGCADAVARQEIEDRFKNRFVPRTRAEEQVFKLLTEGTSAHETYLILSNNQLLPECLKRRIIGYRLLNSILFQITQRAVWSYREVRKRKNKHLSGCWSRSEGFLGFYTGSDEEKFRLNHYAYEVVCCLMGWKCSRKESTSKWDCLKKWLVQQIGSQGLLQTRIPMLMILEGGLTFKALSDIISDQAESVVEADFQFGKKSARIYQPSSLDEPLQNNNDKDCREQTLRDTYKDNTQRDSVIESEKRRVITQIYRLIAKHDIEFADYLWLTLFGLEGFDERHLKSFQLEPLLSWAENMCIIKSEERRLDLAPQLKLLRERHNKPLSKKIALMVFGRAGNTHWECDRARRYLTNHFESERQFLDVGDMEFLKRFLKKLANGRESGKNKVKGD